MNLQWASVTAKRCRRHVWQLADGGEGDLPGVYQCLACGKLALEPMREPAEQRFWSKVNFDPHPTDCWEWMGRKNAGGYGLFFFRGRQTTANRAALILSGVSLDGGREAAHRCDNPACVRPAHLFPATHRENQRDMSRKGRAAIGDRNGARLHPERLSRIGWSAPGEANSQAKLTGAQVSEIRQSTEAGVTLAKRYGVAPSAISRIRTGKRWANA
jgi:hypothetical protein